MVELVETIAKALVDHPDEVSVKEVEGIGSPCSRHLSIVIEFAMDSTPLLCKYSNPPIQSAW